jgi:hypothetical protein
MAKHAACLVVRASRLLLVVRASRLLAVLDNWEFLLDIPSRDC